MGRLTYVIDLTTDLTALKASSIASAIGRPTNAVVSMFGVLHWVKHVRSSQLHFSCSLVLRLISVKEGVNVHIFKVLRALAHLVRLNRG